MISNHFHHISIDPCTTVKPNNFDEDDGSPKKEVHNCVFPFKYKGKTHEKCTKVDSDNGKSWCAYDIQPGTEVPQDGKHWGDCNDDCPGAGRLINEIHFVAKLKYEW